MSSRQRAGFVLAWCVVLLPFAIPLAVLPHFGDLPRHDYWGAFAQVVDGDRLTANPARWLEAHINEHRVTAPLALWAVNAYATAGDDRVLSTVAFALLLATAVLLVRRLPASARSNPWRLAGAGFLVCAWLASPVAARVWAVGFLGTTWLLANFAAILAIAIFCELAREPVPPDRRPPSSFLLWTALAGAGVLGVFSLASSLAVWPALVATALWVRTRRTLVLGVAVVGAILWAVFLFGYETPPNHAPPNLAPSQWLPYLFSTLGLPFSDDVGTARIWGVAGLTLVVAGGIVASRRPVAERLTLAPGVAVIVFATLNSLEIAVARSGFSDRSALAGRYAPIALLFWAGAAWLLVALWMESAQTRRLGASLGVGLVAGLVPLFVAGNTGRVRLREELALVDLQPLAGLALSWQVPDRVALGAVVGGLAQVQGSRAFFERIGHRPFGALAGWRLGEPVPVPAEGDSLEEGSQPGGKLGDFAELSAEFAAISGPLAEGAWEMRRVLVIDRGGLLVGGGLELPRATDLEAHAGDHRARRLRMLRAGSAKTERRWRGYLARQCEPPLRFLAETAEAGDPEGWRPIRVASPRISERVRDWCRPRASEPTNAEPTSAAGP